MAGIEMRSDQLNQVVEDLRERPLIVHDHVGEHDPGQHPVALGDMASEGKPTALLAGEDGIHLGHLRAQVLEPDRQLMHGYAKTLPKFVRHGGGGRAAWIGRSWGSRLTCATWPGFGSKGWMRPSPTASSNRAWRTRPPRWTRWISCSSRFVTSGEAEPAYSGLYFKPLK